MSALVMVDDNLELEEDSFKFLVETMQKISSNCRQKYSVIGTGNVTKDFPSLLMRRDLRVGEKCQIWKNCQGFIGKTKVRLTLLDLVKKQNFPPIA